MHQIGRFGHPNCGEVSFFNETAGVDRFRRGCMVLLSKRLSLRNRLVWLGFRRTPLAAVGPVLMVVLVLIVSTGRAQSGQSQSGQSQSGQSTNSHSSKPAQSQAPQDIPDAPSTVQPPPAPSSPADRPPIPPATAGTNLDQPPPATAAGQ